MSAGSIAELPDDDERAAAEWFDRTYVQKGKGRFIPIGEVGNVNLDEVACLWIHIDRQGMATGWQKISGKWYYFKGGVMQNGWKKLSGKWYFFKEGAMKTGWLKSGGKWYYFNSDGSMATGSKAISGKTYQFDNSGICLNP